MEHRENESRGAQKASSQVMVVEAAAAPVGRRDIAALVGALAGLAATGCLTDAEGSESIENLGSIAQAATGTALRWVDAVLGSALTPGDLATNNSAHVGNAIVVFAKGAVTAGDGGGGLFYWESPSTAVHDGGTSIVPTGPNGGGGRWVRIYSGPLDVRWFGAIKATAAPPVLPATDPDSSNAIQDAIKAAGAAGGGTVYIPPGTYATRGRYLLPNVTLAGAGPTLSVLRLIKDANEPILSTGGVNNCGIRDLGFYGNNENQSGGNYQPVRFENCNDLHIENIFINRGTDVSKGTFGRSAGLYIATCRRFRVHNVEVTGNGPGDGIAILTSAKFELVNPYVHDMAYKLIGANNDQMEGINVQGDFTTPGALICEEWTLVNPRVHDLGGEYDDMGYKTRYTRGIQTSAARNFSILGGTIARVDQGIDLTGGENTRWEIANVIAQECFNFGFKFANSARNGQVNNCTADRCGQTGFVVSPPSGPNIPVFPSSPPTSPASSDIQFVGCVAYDIGYNGNQSTHSGFRVQLGTPLFDTYPGTARGIRFIGCKAHDRQAAPTMGYGFYNEVPASTINGVPLSLDGRYNEAIDCVSIGHTIKAFEGMHSPRCGVSLVAAQSIPSSTTTWTPVQWAAHEDYGGMHDTSSNVDSVVVRRDGVYRSQWGVVFGSNGAGQRGVRILRNGSAIAGTTVILEATKGVQQTALQTAWTSIMRAGDSLRLEVFQSSGAAVELQTTSAGVVEQVT